MRQRWIATLRSGRIAPGEIIDLWQHGELRRVEVGPLDRASTERMATLVLGTPLDQASLDRLWGATERARASSSVRCC